MKNKRMYYLDFLRIFASFSVIFLHCSSQNFYSVGVDSFEWNIFNAFDSLVRWGVPVFVMISGVLFLESKKTIEELYKKNILHIFISFVFWSFIYSLVSYLQYGVGLKESILSFIKGPGHLWYLLMIFGMYMIVPFLKKIIEDEKLAKYFLILSFIFSFVIPQGISVVSIHYKKLGVALTSITDNMHFNFVLGFTFYFMLGYYLNKIKLTKKQRNIIYVLGVIGFVSTALFTILASKYTGKPNTIFYDYHSVNVLFEAIFIFIIFKNIFSNYNPSNKIKSVIVKLSKYSFGSYLVHILVLNEIRYFGFDSLTINPIVSIPLLALIVIIISFSISAIINKIPLLKKYIV